MKSRGYEEPMISFNNEQRVELKKALARHDHAAELFLEDIRRPLTHFVYTTRDCQDDPPPTSTQMNSRMASVKEAADTIHRVLSTCDAYREHARYTDAISWTLMMREDVHPDFTGLEREEYFNTRMGYELMFDTRAELFIEQLAYDLALLSDSLELPLIHARSDPRGRSHNWREIHLIQDIAKLHEKHFGKLPPAHSRSRFHDFVVLALKYVGFPQQSWHRAIKPAIDLLKSPPTD
ncbi:MAG: hypothetical protein C0404_06735 [Verrucomicrobia bacterium]|nr:hypothetical protein [Verrucomicrobiota bacterium]